LLSVPLSALFALFDFIIYNPTHERTKSNLALLGIATGYFCRLEYSSDGALQTSLLSDIAHIARDYIHNVDGGIGVSGASKEQSPAGTESQTPVSFSVRFRTSLILCECVYPNFISDFKYLIGRTKYCGGCPSRLNQRGKFYLFHCRGPVSHE
jgi:hypothetical protein